MTTCSYCGHAGAGIRLIDRAYACAKALCQKLALQEERFFEDVRAAAGVNGLQPERSG